MAGITLVEQGDSVPLVLQIEDGNTGVFPQAVVTTDAGDTKPPINLVHVANGLYQNVWTMANDSYVNVTYIVYSDAYGGTESIVYGRDVDTFCLSGLMSMLDDIKAATEIRQGKVNAAGATTTLVITDLAETMSGFWNRGSLVFTSGQCKGQMRKIHYYNGATKSISFYTPLSYPPALDDTFVIVIARNFRTNIDDNELIADTVWDELESEHIGVGSFGEKVGKLTLDADDNIHAVIKDAGTVPADVWQEHTYDHEDPDTFGLKNQHQAPSEDVEDYKANVSGMVTDIGFLLKIIKNKKELKKNVGVWELIIYDNDNVTPILNKEMKDKDGSDITDLEAGILAQELKDSV